MTNSQASFMQVLASLQKPDVGQAEAFLNHSKDPGLPPRMLAAQQDYINAARQSATKAAQAKDAADRASNAWQAVKENARRTDDLVDMADSATGTRTGAEDLQLNDDDPLIQLLKTTAPASLAFYTSQIPDAEALISTMQLTSNDAQACTVVEVLRGAFEVHKHGLLDEQIAPLVRMAVVEALLRCDPQSGSIYSDLAHNAIGTVASVCGLDVRSFLRDLAPNVLDLLDGSVAITDETPLGDLELAFGFFEHLGGAAVTTATKAAAITVAIMDRAAGERKKSAKKASKKAPKADIEKATREGSAAFLENGFKALNPYTDRRLAEAWEDGRRKCEVAYNEGKMARLNGKSHGANPYTEQGASALGTQPDDDLSDAWGRGKDGLTPTGELMAEKGGEV